MSLVQLDVKRRFLTRIFYVVGADYIQKRVFKGMCDWMRMREFLVSRNNLGDDLSSKDN